MGFYVSKLNQTDAKTQPFKHCNTAELTDLKQIYFVENIAKTRASVILLNNSIPFYFPIKKRKGSFR